MSMAEYVSSNHPIKRRKGGKHKGRLCSCSLHRVIWMEHNGAIPEGMIIHHINGKKKDNRLENLQLLSRKEHKNCHREYRQTVTLPQVT